LTGLRGSRTALEMGSAGDRRIKIITGCHHGFAAVALRFVVLRRRHKEVPHVCQVFLIGWVDRNKGGHP
jgi:hypothetical protein